MNETISLKELAEEYRAIKQNVTSYRLGQHFINICIKESSSDFYCKLWNKKDEIEVIASIYELANKYCWDLTKLPKIDRSASVDTSRSS